MDLDAQRQGKAVVLKTTTRQTIFLPVIGLVDGDALKPSDLVGVNKVGLTTFYYSVPVPASAFTLHSAPPQQSALIGPTRVINRDTTVHQYRSRYTTPVMYCYQHTVYTFSYTVSQPIRSIHIQLYRQCLDQTIRSGWC